MTITSPSLSRTKWPGRPAEIGNNHQAAFGDLVLSITYVAPETLIPSDDRSRVHPDEQIDQIAQSITAFGFLRAILVADGGKIVAGHAIWEAAKRLGLAKVPVVDVSHLDGVHRQAFAIADNKLPENAAWDFAALAVQFDAISKADVSFAPEITGFSSIDIDLICDRAMAKDGAETEEALPSPPPVAVVKVGDVWLLGEHKLFVGDATDPGSYETLMGSERARMAITDPPYNVRIEDVVSNGRTKHEEFLMASGEMTPEEFTAFLRAFMTLCSTYTQAGGLNYIFMDWRHMPEILAAGSEAYSDLLNLVVWAKTNAGMGSFYRSQHELVFVFKSGKAKHLNNVQLGRFGRNRTNVWAYPGMTTNSRGRSQLLDKHPTVKPVAMIADAIRDASKRGEIVLDPFCGSGSTLIAAERTGRICRAIELNPKFADVTIERWQASTGGEALMERSGNTFNALKAKALEKDVSFVGTTPSPTQIVSDGGEGTPPIRIRKRPGPALDFEWQQ
ncbi:site-specific DNA-methyltransferase [Phreatobacter sp.]|uniref:site-specific DNA-methyltransferase n=1 Tax=Phreatobacter sp. TaxID=1966341 RepID=UPI003F6E7B2D